MKVLSAEENLELTRLKNKMDYNLLFDETDRHETINRINELLDKEVSHEH